MKWLKLGAVGIWGASVAALLWPAANPELQVRFLDVGQGDAAVVKTPGGAIIVIDAGPKFEEGRSSSAIILQALREIGVLRVDLFIWTHPEADHIGGAEQLIAAVPVQLVLFNGIECDLSRRERTNGMRLKQAYRGQEIDLSDGTQIEVLSPTSDPVEEMNDTSVIVRVRFGERRFLFTGDAGALAEERILATGRDIRADVLKVGHHGSDTASTEEWLDKVAPTFAVISCGRGNQFGHPSAEVMERLRHRSIHILRTDTDGSIRFVTDGRSLQWSLSSSR